jgi:hypothetical protein
VTEGDRTRVIPPLYWRYIANDADPQFRELAAQHVAAGTPVPPRFRKSVLLALQRAGEARKTRPGNPGKETQHFWLACYYELVRITARSKKDAALQTQQAAAEAGITIGVGDEGYKSVARIARELKRPARAFLKDFANDLLQQSGELPPTAGKLHAWFLPFVRGQLKRGADIR